MRGRAWQRDAQAAKQLGRELYFWCFCVFLLQGKGTQHVQSARLIIFLFLLLALLCESAFLCLFFFFISFSQRSDVIARGEHQCEFRQALLSQSSAATQLAGVRGQGLLKEQMVQRRAEVEGEETSGGHVQRSPTRLLLFCPRFHLHCCSFFAGGSASLSLRIHNFSGHCLYV